MTYQSVLQDLFVPVDTCPFCKRGSYLTVQPFHRYPETRVRQVVKCGYCGCYGPAGRTEAEAVSRWNQREPVEFDESRIMGLLWNAKGEYCAACWNCVQKYRYDRNRNQNWPRDNEELVEKAFYHVEDHVKDDGRCEICDPEIGTGEDWINAK